MFLALWSTGVGQTSQASFSSALSIAVSNLMTNNRSIMTNNVGCFVRVRVSIVASLGDDVLTFFNHGGSNNYFIHLVADLLMVALLLMNNVVVEGALGVGVPVGESGDKAGLSGADEKQKSTKSKHDDWRPSPPSLETRS